MPLYNPAGVSSGAVTTSGLTMATDRLLGRDTASTGAVEELSLGVGLALNGSGVLSAGAWTLVDQNGAASASATWTYSSDVANVNVIGLASYNELLVLVRAVTLQTTGLRAIRVSIDNGSNFYSTSGDYLSIDGDGVGTNATTMGTHATNATTARNGLLLLQPIKITGVPKIGLRLSRIDGPTSLFLASTDPINAIQLIGSAGGNLTGGSLYVFAR